MAIPFIDLHAQQTRIRADLDARMATVLDHGGYILGREVLELETELAQQSGATHVVTCSSGTDALLLALMALGVRPGQGVIVPSFTFTASAEVMPMLGAIPVFAEVDADSFNLDPAGLAKAKAAADAAGISVVGIIAVGLFGQPANLPAISDYAKANGLFLIDDAAQSYGTTYAGGTVGTLADITCTSFFPAKPLGCYGDGGAVFTNNAAHAALMRSLRVHGQGKDKYHNDHIGMTARLDTIQAAILLSKLTIFAEELEMRQAVADRYATLLSGSVKVPQLDPKATSSWAQYTICLPDGTDRTAVQARLQVAGIPTAIYYPVPMHHQTPYKAYPVAEGGLAVTEALCKIVLSLPMHPYLSEADQDKICKALLEAVA